MSIEESCLADLEKSLANNLFIKGAHPSLDDATTFAKFVEAKCVPDQDKYPSVWAWYSLMVLFEDEVLKSWKPVAEKQQQGGKGKGKEQGKKGKGDKKKGKEEVPKKEEDDDMDLFGEETEEEKKAKEEMKAKNKKEKTQLTSDEELYKNNNKRIFGINGLEFRTNIYNDERKTKNCISSLENNKNVNIFCDDNSYMMNRYNKKSYKDKNKNKKKKIEN